jgi:hypothetical protein
MPDFLGFGLGIVIGLVLGLTGAGGSVVAVPLLMVSMGYGFAAAAGASLGAVAAAALFGVLLRLGRGLVAWRLAAILAAGGLLLAPLGAAWARHWPHAALVLSFALLMLVMAVRLYVQALRQPAQTKVVRASFQAAPAAPAVCSVTQGALSWPCWWRMLAAGALTGLLSGLYGVGGGFIIVPALILGVALPIEQAVATSLVVISAVAGSAFAWFAWHSPWPVGLGWVLLGALLGMLTGTLLARRWAGPRLQQGLAVVMVLLAVYMAVQKLG